MANSIPNPVPSAEYVVPPLKGDENYHVFIAHSSENAEFSYTFLDILEETYKLKCFHSSRDFLAGTSVVNNSLQGVQASRRVLMLVTTEFLESDWAIFETQQALVKSYNNQQRVLISVLCGVTEDQVSSEMKAINYLTWGEERFWQRLERAITEDLPLSSAIPAGNVAHGLAWSYFYGYLNLVLPGLRERIRESEYYNNTEGIACCDKMLIMLPKSCCCPEFGDTDTNFSHVGFIPYTASRAGNKHRDYKSSVYRVKDKQTGKAYMFVGEFATPLHSLYEMDLGEIAGLSKQQKLHQYMLFCDKLQEILHHGNNRQCHQKAFTVKYNDAEQKDDPHYLSSLVAHKIQHEIDKEAIGQDITQLKTCS